MKLVLILTVTVISSIGLANTSLESAFQQAVANSESDKKTSLRTIITDDEARMAEWHKAETTTIEVQATAKVDAPAKPQPVYLEDESQVDAESAIKEELSGVN